MCDSKCGGKCDRALEDMCDECLKTVLDEMEAEYLDNLDKLLRRGKTEEELLVLPREKEE